MPACKICGDETTIPNSEYCKHCWMHYHPDYIIVKERGLPPLLEEYLQDEHNHIPESSPSSPSKAQHKKDLNELFKQINKDKHITV